MIIEDKSTYAYQLRHLANPSFEKIRNLAKDFIMKLPEQLKDELYEEIERGEKQLETEPELMYYLHAFGKMHKAKLNYAFEHLPETFFEIPEINIIDYGCGQAVATMCYADFLRRQGYEQKIRRVTLIEPSEAALKRAALHVSVFFPDAEIVTINKEFDDLETKDIVCDEDVPTLHLLSNVLDLECFSLIAFKKLVKKRIGSSNLFVCVGPYFGDKDRGKHMDSFAKSMKGEEIFSEDLDAYELDEGNSWTCMVRCFGVGDLTIEQPEEELSTEVTEEDIANGICDEFGVVYSRDGKRLLKYNDDNLSKYSIKKGTKVIGDYAFSICESLQSIVIPNSVKSIGNSAFSGCKSLQSIVIPDSVTSIGDWAFNCCKSLQSIVIPNSVKSIGKRAFRGCLKLTRMIVEPYNETYDSRSNCNAIIEKKTNKLVAGCSATIIPNSVKSIGDWAFNCCKSLQSIIIPNSVTNIGDSAFNECESLQSIVISDSVTSIGNSAFLGCKSLQSIVIPKGVKNIGNSAFVGCKSLRSIAIPASVTSIGGNPFSSSGICSIVCHSKSFKVDGKALYDRNMKHMIAFYSDDTHFDIPDNVTNIGSCVFRGCESLRSIVIPNSVTSIGDRAFSRCKSLRSIVIPNSVTSIGDRAFSDCKSLQSIDIPNSVTSIGDGAFASCESLQSIIIPNSITTIGEWAFSRCKSLQSIVIPNSVINIGNYAFNYCVSLQSIVIPNSVKSIGDYTFCDCKSLQSIVIPESVTSIGNRAFLGCTSLQSIVIPNSVTSIGDWAFSKCTSLQSTIIPNSVTSIGGGAFEDCKSLRAIIIPKGSRKKFEKLLPDYKDIDILVER